MLEEIPLLQYVAVEDVFPTDFRAKHIFIQSLKLVFPFLLPYYSMLMANLHFVWKVTSVEESSFTDCQKVVDGVRVKIPVYHGKPCLMYLEGSPLP